MSAKLGESQKWGSASGYHFTALLLNGLRDYSTDPLVWGGGRDCEHEWGNVQKRDCGRRDGERKYKKSIGGARGSETEKASTGQFCQHCQAWRGSLGLEPSLEMYIEHLVEIFRETRRVLKDTGVLILNLGDSYASSTMSQRSNGKGAGITGDKAKNDIPRPPVPLGLKPKDLMGIPWRVALALQADGWYLRSAMPWLKCLSGGTRVYARTQKGDMPTTVKDLVRLDPATVKLWNGEKWTQVLGWQETKVQDRKNLLEFHLRTGERIGCTPEHRFPTQRGLVEARSLRIGDKITTCKLPEPEIMVSPEHLPDSIGWFVGMYLAEGSRNKDDSTIQISSHIKELDRFHKLTAIAQAYGGNCTKSQTSENGMCIRVYSHVLNAVIDMYMAGRIAKNKHLANRCWMRSDAFLRNLLEGYLEGDGHHDKKNNRWRLGFTKNDALAADLRTLCARVDVSLRLRRGKSTYNGEPYSYWRGQIRFYPIQDKSTGTQFKHLPDNEIVKIEKSRARKFWDIAVEDDPHLFALASGVLTHNSSAMPESVRDRPTTAHEYVFLLSKSKKYYWDAEAIRVPGNPEGSHSQGHSGKHWGDGPYKAQTRGVLATPTSGRNYRTTDAYIAPLNYAIQQAEAHILHTEHVTKPALAAMKKARDTDGLLLDEDGNPVALRVNPGNFKGAHFATFPVGLVDPFVRAGSKPGSTILDPFGGAMTTMLVADRLQRNGIACELNPDYAEMGRERLVSDGGMFMDVRIE